MSSHLRTFLGSAPGVGKTYAMLTEGRRRSEAGERVVVGWIEPHGRASTDALLRDIATARTRSVEYAGHSFDEVDVGAILDLAPDVVLIDELAHTSADGTRRRWEDVRDLLAAGIEVLTTVNVANIESARDYAARITGAGMVEAVPDDFVRAGDVVLIDLPPEALRHRVASGAIYSASSVGGALSRYFETSRLRALADLAQAWIDDALPEAAEELMRRVEGEPARATIVAGVSGSPWGAPVINRAAAVAEEEKADLVVVHVDVADGLEHHGAVTIDEYRDLAEHSGGVFARVSGDDVPGTIAAVALEHNASRVVVARHRSRLDELVHGSVASRLRRLLPNVDVEEVRTGA